jgi:hypothetical protein
VLRSMQLITTAALVLITACGGGAAPAAQATPMPTAIATAAATQSVAVQTEIPAGTHQSQLAALTGTGTGGVSVTPKAIAQGTFDADIKVRVQKARANATYMVQRAPEIGRASASDGVCQRAAGMSPWSPADPPAPAFVTFMNGTAPYTITTDASGAGSLDFEFLAPTIPAGTLFDVLFRLVDNVDAPTLDIRSGCFTVTVK